MTAHDTLIRLVYVVAALGGSLGTWYLVTGPIARFWRSRRSRSEQLEPEEDLPD